MDGTVITCRLPDRPAADGSELVVTAIDPPRFGPDGRNQATEAGERSA